MHSIIDLAAPRGVTAYCLGHRAEYFIVTSTSIFCCGHKQTYSKTLVLFSTYRPNDINKIIFFIIT